MSKLVEAKKVLSYDFFAFRGGNRTPLYHFYERVLRQFDLLLPCSQFCLRESSKFWDLPTNKVKILSSSSRTRPPPPASAVKSDSIGAWCFTSDAFAIRKGAMFCLKPSRR